MKRILLSLCLLAALFSTAQDTAVVGHRLHPKVYNITINIPDTSISGNIFKRKANLFGMFYNQHAQTLSLTWNVKFYADSLSKYGAYLGGLIADYTKESIASNETFVNPINGDILLSNSDGTYPMDYVGQYDFYNNFAETYSVNIHDLIRKQGENIINWNK